MGFRNDCWATVWKTEKVSDVNTKAQISISKKNKQSGEYETDFSGFVNFIGKECAPNALALSERARVKLKEVDASSKYDKEKKVTYYNFKVFAFDNGDSNKSGDAKPATSAVDVSASDDGELPW